MLATALCPFMVLGTQAAQFEVKVLSNPTRVVIFGGGRIVNGDAARFRGALRQAKQSPSEIHPLLILHSYGGIVTEAREIGRLVKRNGVATAVLSGSACLSACATIFFGGYDKKARAHDRTAYGTARIGVHHWGHLEPSKQRLPPELSKLFEEMERKSHLGYFNEMRVSSEIYRRSYETPFNSMYILTSSDMSASAIAVRPVADAPHLLLRPIEFGCRPACSLTEQPRILDAPERKIVGPGSTPDKSMSGAAYLKGWLGLRGKRIRIAECAFWLPSATEAPCVVTENGARVGFVLVQASTPEKPGWALIRKRCYTPEPIAACRALLTGTVQFTARGPLLVGASAQFLDAGEDTIGPDEFGPIAPAGFVEINPDRAAVVGANPPR